MKYVFRYQDDVIVVNDNGGEAALLKYVFRFQDDVIVVNDKGRKQHC